MDRKTKRLIYNRQRLARQLLLSELRLFRDYSDELDDRSSDMTWDERVYKQRVCSAAIRTAKEMKFYSDSSYRLFELVTTQDMDRTAICDALHISESTYGRMMNKVAFHFGHAMGIWI